MENNQNITIKDIKKAWDDYLNNSNTVQPEYSLWEETVRLFNEFPYFIKFLKKRGHNEIFYPYLTFSFIVDFMDYLYESNEMIELSKIINFLDKMRNSWNIEVINLLDVGVLENFDRLMHFHEIFPLMSEWVKIEFKKYYSHYLNIAQR